MYKDDVLFRTTGTVVIEQIVSARSTVSDTATRSSLREKINANLPQRRHRPVWHPGHVATVRLAEVSPQEFWISVLDDGRANFAHQGKQVVHIVYGQSTPPKKQKNK